MILDADVVIDLLRRHPAALAWLAGLPDVPAISGVAALEVLFGSRDAAELGRVNQFLARFAIAWPEAADARQAAAFAALRLSHGVGLLDCVTAAVALRLGSPLATFNQRHFDVVPGLTTVAPYER